MRKTLNDEDKRFLKERLGDYLSAKELRKRGTSLHELHIWQKQGKLDLVRLNGIWYYSLKSIKNAIQTSELKDLQSH